MRKMTMTAAGALFAATLLGSVTPEIDASGNYTFTVTGTETYADVISGTDITVTKLGDGQLTLTGANDFTGTLLVSGGTLVAAPSATAGKPALVVESGATFKSAGGGATWDANALNLASITISGHGVNNQGAFIRASGTDCRAVPNARLKLMGDATINFGIWHNPGPVNLNGYKLTKIGSGTWYVYNCGNAFTVDGDGGHGSIAVKQGNFHVEWVAFSCGSADNVLELAGGTYVAHGLDTESKATCKWTLNVTADSTISAKGNNTSYLVWNGPVNITGGNLKIEHQAASKTAKFMNTVTATGGYGISVVSSGTNIFYGTVDLGTGMFTHGNPATGSDSTVGGVVEIRGNLVQSGAASTRSLWPKRGVTRIVGGANVSLGGAIGYEYDKQDGGGGISTGRLEVVDVGYLSHPSVTYLSGTQEIPQTILITNSVWNGGSSTMVVGNNFSVGVLDMMDSVVTNTVRVGGQTNDGYAGSRGAVYQKGGEFYSPGSMYLGAAKGQSHGFYLNEGGRVAFPDNTEVRLGIYGYGAAYFIGGTATMKKTVLAAGYKPDSDSSGAGVYWQTGGATNNVYALHLGQATATNGMAIAAIEGPGTRCLVGGGQLYHVARCPFTGILAVNDGAAVRAFGLKRYSDEPRVEGSEWHISMNGGALEATWQGTQWGTGDALPDSVTVQSGGMTLKTDFAEGGLYWQVPLDAPTGKIVSSIALPSDAAFENQQGLYFAPPLVKISGTGKGAAAIALFDTRTRRVTGIRVVAPGTGYDDSTTATIRPANGNTAAASSFSCPVTMADAPTTGAGFTKAGAGQYFMQCANTYKGPTTVAEGKLQLYHAQSLPVGSGLKVCAGATADLRGNTFTVPTLEGAGTITGTSGALTVTNSVTLAMQTNDVLTVNRPLTLADGVELVLTGTVEDLDAERHNVLLSAPGGITCEDTVSLPALPRPWKVLVRRNDVVVTRINGTMMIFR